MVDKEGNVGDVIIEEKNIDKISKQVKELIKNIESIVDYNLGSTGGQQKIEELLENQNCEDLKSVLRGMMNSKPDIAVIYKDSQDAKETRLQFLECKFLSGIGSKNGNTQLKYQDDIGEFLKTYEVVTKFEKTKVVRFARVSDEKRNDKKESIIYKNSKEEYEILITDLIKKENDLFQIRSGK